MDLSSKLLLSICALYRDVTQHPRNIGTVSTSILLRSSETTSPLRIARNHPNKTYEETSRKVLNPQITGESLIEVVFVKEMAYYFEGRFDMIEELFSTAKHSFLIRDPRKVVTSQYRASQNPEIRACGWTYFDPGEVGFRQLHQIYELVKQKLDSTPVVIA